MSDESPDIQLREAIDTLKALEKQLADHSSQITTMCAEKEALAHEALTKGGPAKQRLDRINTDLLRSQAHAADLASAIKTAERNVASGRRRVEQAAARENATKLLALADEIERVGRLAHAQLEGGFSALAQYRALLDQLRKWGGPSRDGFRYISQVTRALAAYQIRHDILPVSFLQNIPPPDQRGGIDRGATVVADVARKQARVILDDKEEAA